MPNFIDKEEKLEEASKTIVKSDNSSNSSEFDKKKIILVVVGLLFVVLGLYYFSKTFNKPKTEQTTKITQTDKTTGIQDLTTTDVTTPVEEPVITEPLDTTAMDDTTGFDPAPMEDTTLQEPSFDSNSGTPSEPKKKDSAISYGSKIVTSSNTSSTDSQKAELEARAKAAQAAVDADNAASNGTTSTQSSNASTPINWKLNNVLGQNGKYTLPTGKIIPALLWTKLNSDLPGQMIAIVRENVYSGGKIIIPQGTKIYGTYDSNVVFAQNRMLVVWNRLIFPNKKTLDLAGMPGADLTGAAGLKDKTNYHTLQMLKGVFLSAVFGAIDGVAKDSTTNTAAQGAVDGATEQINVFGSKIADKSLNKNPTIEIRQGTKFNIMINKDINLPVYK